ncbi:MAG: transposase [Bacillota bacterium]
MFIQLNLLKLIVKIVLIKQTVESQNRKKYNTIRFSDKDYQIAFLREKMETEEYQNLANKRTGIEGVPSTFRRKYNIDNLPIRSKLRVKMWLGFKVIAYNFKTLLKGLKDQNIPSIYSICSSLITILTVNIQEKEFNA